MVRHVPGGFKRPAVMQKHGDAGAAKGVIAEFLRQSRCPAARLDHIEHIPPCGGFAGEPVSRYAMSSVWNSGAPVPSMPAAATLRIQKLLRLAVQPDQLFLVSLFYKPQPRACPPAGSLRAKVQPPRLRVRRYRP